MHELMAEKKRILILIALAAFAVQAVSIARLVQPQISYPTTSQNGFGPAPAAIPGFSDTGAPRYEVTGAAEIIAGDQSFQPQRSVQPKGSPFEVTGYKSYSPKPKTESESEPEAVESTLDPVTLPAESSVFEVDMAPAAIENPNVIAEDSSILLPEPSDAFEDQSDFGFDDSEFGDDSLGLPPASLSDPDLSGGDWKPPVTPATAPAKESASPSFGQLEASVSPTPNQVSLPPSQNVINEVSATAAPAVPGQSVSPTPARGTLMQLPGTQVPGLSPQDPFTQSGQAAIMQNQPFPSQGALIQLPGTQAPGLPAQVPFTHGQAVPTQNQAWPTQERVQLPVAQGELTQLPAAQGAVAQTPGQNERVLSLSPPPRPGDALNEYLPNQPPIFSRNQYLPNYDPRVGHRSPNPVNRVNVYPLDDGEKFSFETKKREFPPFPEIIAQGRFFYNAELLWVEPNFQGNTAITSVAGNLSESVAFDFDSDFQPRFRLGFESEYGPGIELTYFNINSNSELASFTSDGAVVGQSSAFTIGRSLPSSIFADAAGDILTTQHSIDIDSGTVSFFKEIKFPVSRVNGNLGFQYASIEQQLNSNVVSADGAVETLNSTTDLRAWGPRANIEYYRPVGHTPLEFVTSFGGAVLFGQRDQLITNSETGFESRLGADEFLTIIDFFVALQYSKTIGENRSVHGRFGFLNQTWIGGGTATFPQGDFGLRGLTFGIGYNR